MSPQDKLDLARVQQRPVNVTITGTRLAVTHATVCQRGFPVRVRTDSRVQSAAARTASDVIAPPAIC